MRALTLILAIVFTAGTASAEQVRISVDDYILNGDVIKLKQQLRQQGYRPNKYVLNSVKVIAFESVFATLKMNNKSVQAQRTVSHFRVPQRPRFQNGPWQLKINGLNHMNELSGLELVLNISRKPHRPQYVGYAGCIKIGTDRGLRPKDARRGGCPENPSIAYNKCVVKGMDQRGLNFRDANRSCGGF